MTGEKIEPPAVSQHESFWVRRIRKPIIAQLEQGITPDKIALTIALGFVLALFPILGSTTILCLLAAILLRLNQPIIHLVNYFAYPLQIVLLIPFYRLGESLFHRPHVPLSIPLFFARIRADFLQFLRDFGLIAIDGIVVWCLIAPIALVVIYYSVRPPLRALARKV
ncbi:MAG TPA: DUF2062 domain-containing protein [Chthoniobacteraceae bacterium]